MYPGEVAEGGKAKGKLRLMYELAPLSMIAEQAGGRGTTGKGGSSTSPPPGSTSAHPIYIGSSGGSRARRIVQRRRLTRIEVRDGAD